MPLFFVHIMKRLYIIAGEASGDLHGSNLLKALYHLQPDLECRAWGGDLMEQAGATLVKHYRDLAFMGFIEVAKNLRTILRNIAFCKEDILQYKPDALVLIDYPGFNLRIAKWAKENGIKVIYYISPQLWAWHASRAKAIRRDVDKLLVILPFEKAFFKEYGIDAEFVGHPLLDALIGLEPPVTTKTFKKVVALLPGSRKQEVSKMLPVMLNATRNFPEYRFVVAGASSLPEGFYRQYLQDFPEVQLEKGNTYGILQQSMAALVKSGTSTLETALLDVPQVVCYAGNPLSYQIAKRLVKVKYISLVNLIVDKPLVRELIQHELTTENITTALKEILSPEKAAEIKAGYAELRHQLGDGGASERAAKAIFKQLDKS